MASFHCLSLLINNGFLCLLLQRQRSTEIGHTRVLVQIIVKVGLSQQELLPILPLVLLKFQQVHVLFVWFYLYIG